MFAQSPNIFRVVSLLALLVLSACADRFGPFTRSADDAPSDGNTTRLVERDIEAPEVFQVTEPGLWDGRPSLGGVWVAHPDTTDPERVIIRNPSNDKFVIGALFRRERDNPGPALQVSSDAAEALGLLAGAPETLNVTALRREEVSDAPETEATDPFALPDQTADAPETDTLGAPETIAAASLDAVEPVATPPASALSRPFIQIATFTAEENAQTAAQSLSGSGIAPSVRERSTDNGKILYRVLVGPAATEADRETLLAKVRELGFADAYAVSG